MTDDQLIRTIVHLVFDAAKGRLKAQKELQRLSADPSMKDLVERCRAASLKVMTSKALETDLKMLGASAPRAPRTSESRWSQSSNVHVARSSDRRAWERTRMCSACNAPAMPGDSVCYLHIK
jgi:cob(I)alamin adenosyltransferase